MSRDNVAWVTSIPLPRSRSRSCSWLLIGLLLDELETSCCRYDFISFQDANA